MEVFIYHVDSKQASKGQKREDLLQGLPVSMHKRALRYRLDPDAFNFIWGRLLLKKGLKKLGTEEKLEEIQYTSTGKPYLDSVFFNISHTDSRVVCAISREGKLGIDIEMIKPVDFENFTDWFTDIEWADILKSADSLRTFYWYWTRKESIIKALGVNLGYLHQVKLDPRSDYFEVNGKRWYVKDLEVGDGFIGALCTEQLAIYRNRF